MKKKFKILFIDVLDRGIRFQSSYPHLGIGYIISYLKRDTKDLDILVINSNELQGFRRFKPDMVAISSVTQNFNKAQNISKEIKMSDPLCKIIVGGVHISQLPESMDNSMDIGVIGEGEETFLQLVRHIRGGNSRLDDIDGLAFWREGKIFRTKERGVIAELDNIPHPSRTLLPDNENQLLLTSRGCPYRCAFCASSHYWKNLRYFSADYVLEEVEIIIRNYPVLNLTIYDDLFIFNKERLEDISRKIVKAGFHKRVNFWCNARADYIDEDSLRYLKDMNVKGISIGLESGSDRVIKMIKSGKASLESNIRAIELCKENNIFVHGSFMLGSPNETEGDMLKTYDFVKNSGIDKGDIIVAIPLPGTQFWEYSLKEGLVSEDMDWSKLACWHIDRPPKEDDFILLTRELSKERFLSIFRDIMLVFLTKRQEYEKRWQEEQGRGLSIKRILSFMMLKKVVKDPLRGWRYLSSWLFNMPKRILFRIFRHVERSNF